MESVAEANSQETSAVFPYADYGNIALRLRESVDRTPFQRAVVFPAGHDAGGRVTYSHLTFEQLDRESDRLARGLVEMGVRPGMRMVLAVVPSLEFIALTFGLFKSGAVVVLVDPGVGRANALSCLAEVEPDGFVAIPIVHAIRAPLRRRFKNAVHNVTVGRRWFWGGPNYAELLGGEWTPFEIPQTRATDPAAIIFTSGSTGPPKGVLYEHGMFNAQVDLLRELYGIQPGEIDLPGFPLFALFNSAMSVTTVIPDMDPTKPAKVDPARIVQAIRDQGVTQAFGSPAMWNAVGRYCERHGVTFPSLRRVLSAGAPVPDHVLRRMRGTLNCEGGLALSGGNVCGTMFPTLDTTLRIVAKGQTPSRMDRPPDIHTPYGATESLPVTSISGREVLEETAERTRAGAGTCVGLPFPHVRVKIVAVTDGPIASLDDVEELPVGEIGEILVQAPSTTRAYFHRPEATAAAKVPDGDSFWHRMGDVGYLDETGRLWFCGRKAHIVHAAHGRMFSVCCEAIFNAHPDVYRCALVGVGERPQRPVIVAEPEPDAFPEADAARQGFTGQLRQLAAANPLTESIETFLFHRSLPVDVRHNTKIRREELAEWAAGKLG